MGKFLSAEEILKTAKNTTTEEVDCPEWGGKVRVRALNVKERRHVETAFYEAERQGKTDRLAGLATMLAVWCCIDENGGRVFSETQVKQLEEVDAAPVYRIRETVMRISGLNKKAMEEAEADLEPTPGSDSSSA